MTGLRNRALIGAAVLAILPATAHAHPHAWIDLRTTILLNKQGEAVAVREHWLFDKSYSSYAVQDLKPGQGGKFTESDLIPLARQNLTNLREFNYFTVFETHAGKRVKLAEARDIASRFETPPPSAKKKVVVLSPPEPAGARQIAMEFTVRLETPVDLKSGAVYRIYDPTYYVDMAHETHAPMAFAYEDGDTAAPPCTAKVELPKVDQAMIFSAAALDKNAKGPDDLGYAFSERVTLSCSPPK